MSIQKTTITGEQAFQDITGKFTISPSTEGYTLQCSDKSDSGFCDEVAVEAGDRLKFDGMISGLYYKCLGNLSTLDVIFGDYE